jgi:hypothetical protein
MENEVYDILVYQKYNISKIILRYYNNYNLVIIRLQ